MKERETQKDRDIGGLQTTIKSYNTQLDASRSLVSLTDEKRKQQYYPIIEEKIGERTFKLSNADAFLDQFKKHFEELEKYFRYIENILYKETDRVQPLYSIIGEKKILEIMIMIGEII